MKVAYYVKVKSGPFNSGRCITVAESAEEARQIIDRSGYDVISVRKAPERKRI